VKANKNSFQINCPLQLHKYLRDQTVIITKTNAGGKAAPFVPPVTIKFPSNVLNSEEDKYAFAKEHTVNYWKNKFVTFEEFCGVPYTPKDSLKENAMQVDFSDSESKNANDNIGQGPDIEISLDEDVKVLETKKKEEIIAEIFSETNSEKSMNDSAASFLNSSSDSSSNDEESSFNDEESSVNDDESSLNDEESSVNDEEDDNDVNSSGDE